MKGGSDQAALISQKPSRISRERSNLAQARIALSLGAGFRFSERASRIILPQALRSAFPSLFNSLISLVKDTSLASNITVTEMMMTTRMINARKYEALTLYLEVALIYLILSWLFGAGIDLIERRLTPKHRSL